MLRQGSEMLFISNLIFTFSYRSLLPGFPDPVLVRSRKRKASLIAASRSKRPKDLEPGIFVPKNPEVKRRSSYRGHFEDSWWSVWPKRGLPEGPKSPIDFAKLVKRAEAAGVRDLHTVKHVAHQLEHGAPLGARQAGRLPYEGPNNKSCYDNGHLWCDAVCSYIKCGFMCGPFLR